jgi:hypothetical protein
VRSSVSTGVVLSVGQCDPSIEVRIYALKSSSCNLWQQTAGTICTLTACSLYARVCATCIPCQQRLTQSWKSAHRCSFILIIRANDVADLVYFMNVMDNGVVVQACNFCDCTLAQPCIGAFCAFQKHSTLLLLLLTHRSDVRSKSLHTRVPLFSVPLHSVLRHSVPLHSVPLHSVPIHCMPLHSV